jgi:hypothetical protein
MISVSFKRDGQDLTDLVKADLKVLFESAGKNQPLVSSIMEGGKGVLHVGFTPKVAGQYWIDFIVRGNLAAEPYMLPIKTMNNSVPSHPYVGEERARLAGAKAPESSAPVEKKPEPKVEEKKPEPKAEPKPEPKVEEKKPEPKPEPKVEEKKPEPKPEPKVEEKKLEPKPEPIVEEKKPEPQAEEKKPEPKPEPKVEEQKPEPKVEPKPEPKAEPKPLPKPPKPEPAAEPRRVLKTEPTPEPKVEQKVEAKPASASVEDDTIASVSLVEVAIVFRAIGKNGKELRSGGEDKKFQLLGENVLPSALIDLGEGRYTFDFKVDKGTSKIDVKFADQDTSVKGFPVTISI